MSESRIKEHMEAISAPTAFTWEQSTALKTARSSSRRPIAVKEATKAITISSI